MKTKYHIEITAKALSDAFSEPALEDVIKGNIQQDKLFNQIGHDYIHFDGSAFETGFAYLSQQRKNVLDGIKREAYPAARFALGRVTHSWQDFYSHSNYVKLWLAKANNQPPKAIVINDGDIINHPELKSGKNYGLIELVALIPGLKTWIKQMMPADSHARMNLDGPEAGERFLYAYTAAIKQTRAVFDQMMSDLKVLRISQKKVTAFLGKYKIEERYNHVYE
jgi:hypothetical protein